MKDSWLLNALSLYDVDTVHQMKQPCQRTLDLIGQLENLLRVSKPLFFKRRFEREVVNAKNLLSEIEKVGDWTAVPNLLQFVLQLEIEISEAAGRCIDVLLRNIRPTQLLQLEERLGRGLYVSNHLNSWRELNSFTDNKYVAGNSCSAVTAMFSFHKNGFIREPAVKHLSQIKSGAELPYLLIRLADWVPQVRIVAENAVEERVKPDFLHHFVDTIALLDRIKQKQRNHGIAKRTALIEHITRELLLPTNKQIFFDGLQHRDIAVRRTLIKILRDSNISELSEYIELAIRDKDKTNRKLVIETSHRLPYLDRLKLLNRLLYDRCAFIRLESLRTLCDEHTDTSTSQLTKALLDRSSAVRLFARWKLKDIGSQIDFKQFYLEQIATNKNASEIAAAASGLEETGSADDAEKLISLLLHPSVTVQKSAIRALAKLDSNNYSDLFIQKLHSDISGISRAGADALSSLMPVMTVGITAEQLWQTFSEAKSFHVKRNVLRLLDHTSQWERAGYLLLVASGADAQLRAVAQSRLRSWFKEFQTSWAYTKPTAKQIELLRIGMKDIPDQLPTKLREILELSARSNA